MAKETMSLEEFYAGAAEPETEAEAKAELPKTMTLDEFNAPQKTVYLDDKDQIYNYPAADDEDTLNEKLQTQVYGADPNKFLMGVNTGIDVMSALGRGFASFFPATAMRTAAGSLFLTAERMEEGAQEEEKMAFMAGMPAKAIFDTVLSLAAKQTDVDDDIAQSAKDLIKASNEMLNNTFFKPGETPAEKVAFDLGGAGASLFTAIGLTVLTKSPNAAAALFGQIAASDTYIQAREEGATPREAYQAALTNFATEAGLEYLGIDAFMRYLRGSKTVARIFAKMSTEFVQEASQTLGSNVSMRLIGKGEQDWGKVIQEMLYSGAIGFVTGGLGGAVQVIRENRAVIGEFRKAGFSDAEIEDIILPVMQRAYTQQFKQATFNALQREIETAVAKGKEAGTEKRVVVDADGNPVTLGPEELADKDKFFYRDKTVVDLETADRYLREQLGDLPKATDLPEAEVRRKADPVVQARIAKIEDELKPLYNRAKQLALESEKRDLSKRELKELARVQKEIQQREIERDEVGYEWQDTELVETEVAPGKEVKMTAGQVYRAKIAEAKDQVRQFKAGMKTGQKIARTDIDAFQKKLIELIDMSDILTDNQKKRMLKTVRKTQTETAFGKRVIRLEGMIKQLEVANAKNIYTNAISRILKKAQTRKFDADTRRIFDELIKLNKQPGLNPDVFQAAYDGSFESVLRFDIATYGGIDPSLRELQRIYYDLKSLYEDGINTRTLERQQRKEQIEKDLETVNKEIAGKYKPTKADPNARPTKKSRKRLRPIGMFVWDSVMNFITRGSGKGEGQSFIEKRFDTFKPFETMTKLRFYYKQKLKGLYKDIFNLASDADLFTRQQQDLTETFTFSWLVGAQEEIVDEQTGEITQEAKEGEWKEIELTKAEMRKRYMEWQRDVGRKTLTRKNLYTEELMEDITNSLTEGDLKFIEAQFRVYDELYALVNPIYRKHKGIDLAYDDFYSPLFTIGGAEADVSFIDFMAGQEGQNFFGGKITSNDRFKRATGGSSGVKILPDLVVLDKYINDMSHFIGYADLAMDVETLLLNPDTRANIKANYGDAVVDLISQEAERIKGKIYGKTNVAWEWVKNITAPLARSFLMKPVIGVKQLVSHIAYMAKVPPVYFTKYMAELVTPTMRPKVREVTNALRANIVMQARGDIFEREIQAIHSAVKDADSYIGADKRLRWSRNFLIGMRLGDRGAIYAGGYCMYRYLTEKKKVSHSEAIDQVLRFTNLTQQSPDPMQLSSGLADRHPISRLFTLFKQAPTQYFNAMAKTIWNAPTVSRRETARKLLVYHAILPMLWQFVANGFQWDWEDELKAGIAGPLAYIYLLGEGLTSFIGWALAAVNDSENKAWRSDMSAIQSWAKSVEKTVKGVYDLIESGGLDADDTIKLIQDLAKAAAPAGGAVSGTVEYTIGLGKAALRLSEGEYVDALQKFVGYSDYITEKDE